MNPSDRARCLWARLCAHPWLASIAVLALACAIARPWGNFPLNDDWLFAVVAKRFGESNRFVIDLPVAPALLGQSLLAWPVVRIFGFSHLAMRLLTLAVSALLLLAVDRLLRAAETRAPARAFTLVTLALSPFFFYLATTFMTEMYGLAPAMLGAAIWLTDRTRAREQTRAQAISWRAAILTSLLCGFAFLTRQFSSLVLPALFGATAISLLLERQSGKLWRALPRFIAAFAIVIACAIGHRIWSRATHNFPVQQQVPLSQILRIDTQVFSMQPGIFLLYMTGFSLPLLLLFPRRARAWKTAIASASLIATALYSHHVLQGYGFSEAGVRSLRHTCFPWIGEALFNAGLGPITLSDQFWSDQKFVTHWSERTWLFIEMFLIAASVGWTHAATAFARAFRERPRAFEVALFGVVFSLGSFFAALLVEQPWVHDRYYFPCALGLAISLGALIDPIALARSRRGFAAIALAVVAWFSIAAVHDEFRWNDARWQLVELALASGAHPLTIDGGYEVTGWLHRSMPPGTRPQGCLGRCHCPTGAWECQDDSNRIGLSLAPDYAPVKSIESPSWLGEDPVLIWSRRR